MQEKFQLKIWTGIDFMTKQSLAKVLHKLTKIEIPIEIEGKYEQKTLKN